ncbi:MULTISPECIES: XdhC family aldehyde oxidoreductase maturation factor [Lacrimispora]|uniref:XdhC family aldehyde oxidoreductase maturation factor n=1 Tax=Lacrimispora TaxID=2719231 RepID=UPI000BE44452|nr:XdhC/CoxI family protein [Lacrimispora amygdalina]MDK2968336.1 xanthine dehydrogenase accessory factor [Lacrimispora sp.]
MDDCFEKMITLLRERQDFVVATIVSKSGSAPRVTGTKMIIRRDFTLIGSIGGGMMEAMVTKLSSGVFESREYVLKDFILLDKADSAMDMVCGGGVKVLIEYVDPYDADAVRIYEKAAELKKQGTEFVLITMVHQHIPFITGKDKWICTETAFYGEEDYDVQRITTSIRENFNHIEVELQEINARYLIEPFYRFEQVCIIGAGHIAQKIAALTKELGFYTVVVDDRKEFASKKRFQTSDEVRALRSLDHLSDKIIINHDSYIIIVTRGHSYDMKVLAQMLKTDARYIGVIGSSKKRDYTYQELLQEGFTKEDVKRIFCPIGLNIHAETPEEIAVSIAAELIKVRRGKAYDRG